MHILADPLGSQPGTQDPATPDLPTRFVDNLVDEALGHRAVHHPYLQALATGGVPDLRWALADFARQYLPYSHAFPRYLTAVIARLDDPAHRSGLIENLTEESGRYEQEELDELADIGVPSHWIDGVPHPVLFRRFGEALGVSGASSLDEPICWRDLFLTVLTHGTPAEAVGALGLGTETIVSTMYRPFVTAIGRFGELDPRDTVFFPLHTAVDDHHQAVLKQIAIDHARTQAGRTGLRHGMLKALQLRCAFWDWMQARAHTCGAEDERSARWAA